MLSPDSSYVVFYVGGADGHEIFSKPVDEQTPATALSPPLLTYGGAPLVISPDSSAVVMTGWTPEAGQFDLMATPIAEQQLTKLAEGLLWDPVFTPDSARVLYKVGDLYEYFELFVVELDGSAEPRKLAGPLFDGEGSSASFDISPDSQWIVMREYPRTGRPTISSMPIAGGDLIPLGMSPAGRINACNFAFTADSHLIYPGALPGAEWTDLYREPINGGGSVSLTAEPGSGDAMGRFILVGEPELIVYTARAGAASAWDVFTVPAAGGAALRLTYGFDGGYGAGPLVESPDSSRIVIMAYTGAANDLQHYSVPISGGSMVRLSGPEELQLPPVGAPVMITPDSARVIYAAHPAGVYSVPIGVECAGHFATIVGTRGADELIGTSGRDIIHGRGGNDLIRGKGGRDVICAGSGADIVYGGRGGDTLIGGSGADQLHGGRGGDILRGKSGADTLNGGRGTDACFGGAGRDTLIRCE